MLTYASEVLIERPPDEVFPYLDDVGRQALWSDVQMRQLTEGNLKTGSRLEVSFGMGPLKARVGLELTDVASPTHMAFRTFSGPIAWDGEYRLVAVDGGTRVSQRGSLAFHGLWRLMEPLAGAEISRGEVKELERLKEVVERG